MNICKNALEKSKFNFSCTSSMIVYAVTQNKSSINVENYQNIKIVIQILLDEKSKTAEGLI